MTPQQAKFVQAYCQELNATRAALKAGYSAKTARQQGSRLLTIVDIKSEIKKMLSFSGLGAEEIAARWDRIATVDLSDFYTRRQVEHTPFVTKTLTVLLKECRESAEFEQEVAIRTEALIVDRKERQLFRKRSYRQQLVRERAMLRLEMEQERNPSAKRIVAGPRELRSELQLDLVKAEDLGVLDLIKSITDGRNGTSFSLRDPDAALDNLAKWRGMLTNKIDITSGGEALPVPAVLGVLNTEQARLIIQAREQLRALPPKND